MHIRRLGELFYTATLLNLTLGAFPLFGQLAPPPYVTDFEVSSGISVGTLDLQDGWQVPHGTAIVGSSSVFSGIASVELLPSSPPTKILRSFAPATGFDVYYLDLWARPVASLNPEDASLIEPEGARVSVLRVDSAGRVMAWDSNEAGVGTWIATGCTFAVEATGQAADFHRFTFCLNYRAKKWNLYVDGKVIAFELGLSGNSASYFSQFQLSSTISGSTFLDSLYVGTDNPLFIDSDNDGLADDWEVKYLGTLNYGPMDDPGGVGRTLLQSYEGNQSPWPAPVVANGLRAW